MLGFPGTGQVRSTCMSGAGGEGAMYVKSVEYAVRNPACCANTYGCTRTLGPTSASTATSPSKPKVVYAAQLRHLVHVCPYYISLILLTDMYELDKKPI